MSSRIKPTAIELTAIRPGSDPEWLMSPCCHQPHHLGTCCPGCGNPPNWVAELKRRHRMLVLANELIERMATA